MGGAKSAIKEVNLKKILLHSNTCWKKKEVHCCDLHEGGGNKYDCKVTAYIFRLPESLGLPIVVCCQLTILHF